MTNPEKIALIKAGISHRHDDYQWVKAMQYEPLYHIEIETGFTVHFITKCRKIAGWTRRKQTGK